MRRERWKFSNYCKSICQDVFINLKRNLEVSRQPNAAIVLTTNEGSFPEDGQRPQNPAFRFQEKYARKAETERIILTVVRAAQFDPTPKLTLNISLISFVSQIYFSTYSSKTYTEKQNIPLLYWKHCAIMQSKVTDTQFEYMSCFSISQKLKTSTF